jgi:ribosomal RNA assembly protein
MTEQIYSEKSRKVISNKKEIERAFNLKISSKGNIIFIEGKPEDELLALNAIEAINLGFPIDEACYLKDENIAFQKISIKTISKKKNRELIRGRIIGERRRVLDTIEDLTDCKIVVHDNLVGIIGRIEDIEKAVYAVKKIIAGSRHASIYAYLEEQKALERHQL